MEENRVAPTPKGISEIVQENLREVARRVGEIEAEASFHTSKGFTMASRKPPTTPPGNPGFIGGPKTPHFLADGNHPSSLLRKLTPTEVQIARALYSIASIPGCVQLHGATYHAQRRTGEFDTKTLAALDFELDKRILTIAPIKDSQEVPMIPLTVARGSLSPWGDSKKDALRVLASYKAKEFGSALDQMIVNMEGSYIEEIIADAWTARMIKETWSDPSKTKTRGLFKGSFTISEDTTDNLTALLTLPIHIEPSLDEPRPGPNPFSNLCPLVVDADSIVSRQYYEEVEKEQAQEARKKQFKTLSDKFEALKKTISASQAPPTDWVQAPYDRRLMVGQTQPGGMVVASVDHVAGVVYLTKDPSVAQKETPKTGMTGRHPQNVLMDGIDAPYPMEAQKGEILRLLHTGTDPRDLNDQQKLFCMDQYEDDENFRKAFDLWAKKRGPQ